MILDEEERREISREKNDAEIEKKERGRGKREEKAKMKMCGIEMNESARLEIH